MQAVLSSQLHKRITGPGSDELIERIRRVSSSIPKLPPDIREQAIASYQVALRSVFIMISCLAAVNLLICIVVSSQSVLR